MGRLQDSHVFHPVAPRIGELPNASPKVPHAPRRRPTLQEHPAGIPYRPTLPEPAPEKLKALLAPRKIHQPRLLRMRLQPKMLKRQLHPSPGFFRVGPTATEHHEIIGVPDEHAEGPRTAAATPGPTRGDRCSRAGGNDPRFP